MVMLSGIGPRRWMDAVRIVAAAWFFVGMPLSLVLSGLYGLIGAALPPLLFFLPGLVYLSGGLLGSLWSSESLWKWRQRRHSGWDIVGTLFVLFASLGFVYLGVTFVVMGLHRL